MLDKKFLKSSWRLLKCDSDKISSDASSPSLTCCIGITFIQNLKRSWEDLSLSQLINRKKTFTYPEVLIYECAVCILLFMNVEHESKKRNVPLGISRNPIFPIHITKCFRGHKKAPNISCVRIRKDYISIFVFKNQT